MSSPVCLCIPIIHTNNFLKITPHLTMKQFKDMISDTYRLRVEYTYDDNHDVASYENCMFLQPKMNIPCKINGQYFEISSYYDDVDYIAYEMKKMSSIYIKDVPKSELTLLRPIIRNQCYDLNILTITITYDDVTFVIYMNTCNNYYKKIIKNTNVNIVHPQYNQYEFTNERGDKLLSYNDFKYIDGKYNYTIIITKKEPHTDSIIFNYDDIVFCGLPSDHFPNKILDYYDDNTITKTFMEMTDLLVQEYMQCKIIVGTITGKRIPIIVTQDMLISELKQIIQNKEGIPPNQQILVFKRHSLEENMTIGNYNINRNSQILLHLDIRGGGIFTDVSKRFVEDKWSSDAPQWRTCSNGINFESKCTNELCVALNMKVIHPHKYGSFNLLNQDMQCPMCKTPLKASNFIATRAKITIIGKTKCNDHINKTIHVCNDPMYPPSNSFKDYEYLMIHNCDNNKTKCNMCHGSSAIKKFKICEHVVCVSCLLSWEHIFTSCPICMLHI
jgi:ubiquitin-large subunit ribosomal protein L40e